LAPTAPPSPLSHRSPPCGLNIRAGLGVGCVLADVVKSPTSQIPGFPSPQGTGPRPPPQPSGHSESRAANQKTGVREPLPRFCVGGASPPPPGPKGPCLPLPAGAGPHVAPPTPGFVPRTALLSPFFFPYTIAKWNFAGATAKIGGGVVSHSVPPPPPFVPPSLCLSPFFPPVANEVVL